MDRQQKKTVFAICADYQRRARLIGSGRLPAERAANYARMNAAIDSAIRNNIDACDRADMMRSLQDRRGYLHGGSHRGRNQFYTIKQKIVQEIADALNL